MRVVCPILGSQCPVVVSHKVKILRRSIILKVEENDVDAGAHRVFLQRSCHLHQHSYSASAVVSTIDWCVPFGSVRVVVGERS